MERNCSAKKFTLQCLWKSKASSFKPTCIRWIYQGSDVVLGMQWLQSLGKVLHDWSNLTVEFWNEVKKFVLQGDNTRRVTHGIIQSIQELLASGLETYVMTINGPIYYTKVDSA